MAGGGVAILWRENFKAIFYYHSSNKESVRHTGELPCKQYSRNRYWIEKCTIKASHIKCKKGWKVFQRAEISSFSSMTGRGRGLDWQRERERHSGAKSGVGKARSRSLRGGGGWLWFDRGRGEKSCQNKGSMLHFRTVILSPCPLEIITNTLHLWHQQDLFVL